MRKKQAANSNPRCHSCISLRDIPVALVLPVVTVVSVVVTFIQDKVKKEKREFFIPKLNRERNLYGSDFEVKLRNKFEQKAIAKECADWIRKKSEIQVQCVAGGNGWIPPCPESEAKCIRAFQ